MLKKISYYIFQKRFQNYLLTTVRNPAFINYCEAKSILLLFESNYTEKNTKTKQIIENMIVDGKNVTAIGYVNKSRSISAIYPEYRVLSNKDIGCFKQPKQAFLEPLLNDEYDLLIDITTQRLLPLEYIALYANAKCKAGMRKNKLKLYDFSVDLKSYLSGNEILLEDLAYTFLYDQIIFYLKNIQSKDY